MIENVVHSVRIALARYSLLPLTKALTGHSGIAASVIIVTRNRATYLDLALAALERQVVPHGAWEVVVMDEGSQDTTPDLLQRYAAQSPLRVMTCRAHRRRGYAEARNEAVGRARGTVVVFLKDTSLAEPTFLLNHLKCHLTNPRIVMGDESQQIHTHLYALAEPAVDGVTPAALLAPADLDCPEQIRELIFDGATSYEPLFAYFKRLRQPSPVPWAIFVTGNASVRREQLLAVGGFDERFSGWGLEDMDLALRLYRAGIPFQFEPQARTLRQVCPKRQSLSVHCDRDIRHFLYKHPDLDAIGKGVVLRKDYAFAE